jgi:large subunit ribosomal protein L13
MTTFTAKPKNIKHDWYIIDASNKTLGRLATTIASYLRGKHKPEFTTHIDTGDYIIVINADKIRVTGNKESDKIYRHYSGYPGGLKTTSFASMMKKTPKRVLELAVKGMLPKGPLGRQMFRKLKIYAGPEHPHTAQNPQVLEIKD